MKVLLYNKKKNTRLVNYCQSIYRETGWFFKTGKNEGKFFVYTSKMLLSIDDFVSKVIIGDKISLSELLNSQQE